MHEELAAAAALMLTDAAAAADRLDAVVAYLKDVSARLRDGRLGPPAGHPTSGGGAGDRARLALVGPDGRLKHDTGWAGN